MLYGRDFSSSSIPARRAVVARTLVLHYPGVLQLRVIMAAFREDAGEDKENRVVELGATLSLESILCQNRV